MPVTYAAHLRATSPLSSRRSPIGAIPLEKLVPDGEMSFTFTPPERFEPVIPPQSQTGPVNPRWKLPPSEWPLIVERVDQGESLREIAASYGVTYPVVRKAEKLARLGLNLPPRPRPSQWKIPEVEWPAVLQQIEQGVSLSQIGRLYGVSRKAVKRVEQAVRQRLQMKTQPSAPSYPGNIPPPNGQGCWSALIKERRLLSLLSSMEWPRLPCDEWRRSHGKRWECPNDLAIGTGRSSHRSGPRL